MRGQAWTTVGERCHARRHPRLDVTVGVVVGADALLVVDSLATLAEAARLRAEIVDRWGDAVAHLVNTHGHFDHCFGNAAFGDAALWGHASLPKTMRRREAAARAEAVSLGYRPKELPATLTPPTRLVAGTARADLGGLSVDLCHLGLGHTDGDLVAHVPAAGVVFCGDLVEQSAGPQYGADSHPLQWPATLGRLLDLAGPDAVYVPGHGQPVDAAFVRAQRRALTAVAEAIGDCHAAGLGEHDASARLAVAASAGAFGQPPPGGLDLAVGRGYARLRASHSRE